MNRSLHTVGISDCQVSKDPHAVLATHALGSCIAVAIHDPTSKVSGLLHFMLPESASDPEKAKTKPYMFADTGIPAFFRKSYELGAVKQRLKVSLMGGASVIQTDDMFQIGKRNHVAARKILWRAGVMVQHEAVGGTLPRTVHMNVGSGKVVLSHGREEQVLVPSDERSEKE